MSEERDPRYRYISKEHFMRALRRFNEMAEASGGSVKVSMLLTKTERTFLAEFDEKAERSLIRYLNDRGHPWSSDDVLSPVVLADMRRNLKSLTLVLVLYWREDDRGMAPYQIDGALESLGEIAGGLTKEKAILRDEAQRAERQQRDDQRRADEERRNAEHQKRLAEHQQRTEDPEIAEERRKIDEELARIDRVKAQVEAGEELSPEDSAWLGELVATSRQRLTS